jgi:RNA polymerase sigma-54 factor
MPFELKQNLKLTQQLIMTPQLQQAIRLLQMSRLDLVDAVNDELDENPLLEEVLSDEVPEAEEKIERTESDEEPPEQAPVVAPREELTGEGDGREEFDWDGYLEDYAQAGYAHQTNDENAPVWETIVAGKTTLADHLLWQLMLSQITEKEQRVAEQIIGNLDENGYLVANLEEIAILEKTTQDFVEKVLAKVQELDPPGIAARNLRECLLLQARALGGVNPVVEEIIRSHLDDLRTKNYAQIARRLKISKKKVPMDDIMAAVKIICNMDPHPGSAYNEGRIEAIVPDVFVVKSGDDYKVLLNEEGIPRLRISNYYREITQDAGRGKYNGKQYIKERMQSANWLIKSIQQRQRTIRRVAESIVRFQKDFFDRGIDALKPLILRDVAEELEMHESTISRVVTNKYLHSAQGTFEMKYFFGSGIRTSKGEDVSSKSVQEEIRKLIASENPCKPLSDKKIVELLEAAGIKIARRTIAKYRDVMGVLPSSMRKKYQ